MINRPSPWSRMYGHMRWTRRAVCPQRHMPRAGASSTSSTGRESGLCWECGVARPNLRTMAHGWVFSCRRTTTTMWSTSRACPGGLPGQPGLCAGRRQSPVDRSRRCQLSADERHPHRARTIGRARGPRELRRGCRRADGAAAVDHHAVSFGSGTSARR